MQLPALWVGVAATLTAAALTVGPVACTDQVTASTATVAAQLAAAASTTGSAVRLDTTAARGVTVKIRLREAVRRLPVAAETRNGYDRDTFNHWIDANGDCQDTRDEVLAAESTVSVSGCDISTGRWKSYYDKLVWTDSADVDTDHLVPLAESWDSGAKRWNAETRERFANDLHDPRPLVAVTDNVNQSKADQDPAEWMPQFGKCTYVRQWVAVKIRWSLKADHAETRSLRRHAENCKNTFVKVNKAQIGLRRAGNSAGHGAGDGGGSGGTCTTGYTPCLPPPPPDLDRADVKAMSKTPVKVWGSDPHQLDGDNDGSGCTS